jgi:hypothetical protein
MHQNLQFIRFTAGSETVFVNINHICAIVCSERGNVRLSTIDGGKFEMQRESWQALVNAHIEDRVIWSG